MGEAAVSERKAAKEACAACLGGIESRQWHRLGLGAPKGGSSETWVHGGIGYTTLAARLPSSRPYSELTLEGGCMKYFEDFQVGETVVTRARTVTETDIVSFAALTGDWYPLHTDVEYAKKGPFGERIAHGLLVLSIANGLLPLYDMAIIAFYGMDKVRFTAPTKIGDTIHVELEVVGKDDKGEMGGVITLKESVKNQKGEAVALSTLKAFIGRPPKSA